MIYLNNSQYFLGFLKKHLFEKFLLRLKTYMFDREKNIFFGIIYVYFPIELLILPNKTSSPKDFEFTRFICI